MCCLSRVYIRTQTQHATIKRSFYVDVLSRRGKQHLAVRRTISKQLNAIVDCRYFKEIRIQWVYIGSIQCLCECQTVYKCTIRFASPHLFMHRSRSDVNLALQISISRKCRLILLKFEECFLGILSRPAWLNG